MSKHDRSNKPREGGNPPAPGAHHTVNESGDKKEAVKERREHWLLRFTGMLTAFTAIYAVTSLILLCETKRSVDLLDKTSQAEMRAWVIPDAIPPIPLLAAGQETFMWINIRNFGKLPAVNVTQRSSTFVGKALPLPPPYPPDTEKNVPGTAIIGPGGMITVRVSIQARSDREIDGVRPGNDKFFVYGLLEYSDEFRVKRATTFCIYTDNVRMASIAVNCPVYNEPR